MLSVAPAHPMLQTAPSCSAQVVPGPSDKMDGSQHRYVWLQALDRYFTMGIDSSVNKMPVELADTLFTVLHLQLVAHENLWLPLMAVMGSMQSLFAV